MNEVPGETPHSVATLDAPIFPWDLQTDVLTQAISSGLFQQIQLKWISVYTIFELIMVDISQHSLIEISYVYVILCFRIPTSCRYKKNHNHFKDHHFWEHRAHPSPTTPSVQGGADPTSLRQGLDLAKCASTRKICRGWRCWRPVGGLGWCQFCWGGGEGWWGMLPGIGEALVVLKLWKNFPKKKGDVSQKVVAFYWDARGVVFSFFRFLFCMFVVFFTCSIEKIESHQCANFNRRWYRVK